MSLKTTYSSRLKTLIGLSLLATMAWTGSASAQSTDDGLTARVEQLEQQIVDLQVALGTLETLAKGLSLIHI